MGNLSWFPEGRSQDSGKRGENNPDFVQMLSSYRHRAAYAGRNGGYLGFCII